MSEDGLFKGDGSKLFSLARERDVDSAVKKVKEALKDQWFELPSGSRVLFESAFARSWSIVEKEEWGSFRFSLFELHDAERVLQSEKKSGLSGPQKAERVLEVLRETKTRH